MQSGQKLLAAIFKNFDERPDLDEVFFNGPDVSASGSFASSVNAGMLLRQDVMPPLQTFFDSSLAVLDWLQDLAAACNTRLDPMFPSAGGNIPGQAARWHAIFPPLIRNGPVFCVRRNRFAKLTLDDFEIKDPLRAQITGHLVRGGSLLVSGPTGSGKSSFLAAVLRQFFSNRRMVIIETVEELDGLSSNFLNMVARPPNLAGVGAVSASWLFQEALRLRPDGIVIGEIRGQEAAAFAGAISSGHASCFATIHSGSVEQARNRLTWLAGEATSRHLLSGSNAMVVQMARGGISSESAVIPAMVGYGPLSGLQ